MFDSEGVVTCLVKSVSQYAMDGGNEQRVAIKFCSKVCLSTTKTLVLVPKAFGNEALNQSHFLGGIHGFEMEGSW
jgi:hypothetical protein